MAASDVAAWAIIEQVESLARGMSVPVFRGQADSSWDLRSGAVQRIVEAHGDSVLDNDGQLRNLVSTYHHNIRRDAEIIDGQRMPLLQRLAALQHLGAATGFLDFTRSALVAIWFACEAKPGMDGRVFVLDIGDSRIAVDGRGLDDDEGLFNTARPVYYEPYQSLGARVIAQQSVFVICNPPSIPELHVPHVDVPAKSKKPLREQLERLGVSRETLFRDLQGLARASSRTTPLPLMAVLTPEQHRDRGARAYQAQQYEDALADYELYAAALPEVSQPHCLVGDTLAAMGRFDQAAAAYTLAIENIGRPMSIGQGRIVGARVLEDSMLHTIYYNRGNVRAAAGHHVEAIADFDQSLDHGTDLQRNVLANRGNSNYALGRFVEASQDFEAAWTDRGGSDAALALGNSKMMLGNFREALQRYRDGAGLNEPERTSVHCRQNAERCSALLESLEGHDYEVRCQEGQEGVVTVVGTMPELTIFPFVGNRGNIGNTPSGMMNAPGGEGYEGMTGFAVLLRPA